MTQLILASASPRRRALIQLLQYPVTAVIADVDEAEITHPNPAVNAVQTAELKANAIAHSLSTPRDDQLIIIGSDTIVAFAGQLLGKPKDAAEAHAMLSTLRNQQHQVHTGVFLIEMATGRRFGTVHSATVTMRNYSEAELTAYVATGDPLDKAGAYAIQNKTFHPVAHLEGCFTGVMGLSICHLLQLLTRLDVPIRADQTAVWLAHQQYSCPLYKQLFVNSL